MNVTIIGAGNMGRGIGTRLVAGGHSVTLVDANPETAEKTAAAVRAAAQDDAQVFTASLGQAELGEVVVLAVSYGTNIEIARQLGSKLAGKVIVDIANPLNSSFDGLATAPDSSSAEDVAKALAAGAKVVKAFNTTYAGTLIAGQVAGQVHFVDNPARPPVPCHFTADGMVICKRHFGRAERGDCVFHLAVDYRP